jgi:peptidoglycan/LPS O-acetylase OafA/YrhL
MLDGLRAVAVGMVLLTHAGFLSGEVARGAHGAVLARFDVGVAIFFVLSGFLLYRPFAEAQLTAGPSPSTKRYLVRRVVRILPAYWIALAAVLIASSGVSSGKAIANAAVLQVYGADLLPNFTQTWSLSTEVAFYVALPILAVALARFARGKTPRQFVTVHLGLLGACAVACWAFIAVIASSPDPAIRRANTWLPGHLDWFAVGMALAAVWAAGRREPTTRVAAALRTLASYPGTCLLAAATLFWLAATPLGGPRTLALSAAWQAITKEALYAAVAGLLVVIGAFGDHRRGPVAVVLASRPSRYLGRISYAMFLWHLLLMRGVYDLMGWPLFSGHFVGVALLTAFCTVAVAAVSWGAVERPLLNLTQRRRNGTPPSARLAPESATAAAAST